MNSFRKIGGVSLFIILVSIGVGIYFQFGSVSQVDSVKVVKVLGAELLAAQAEGNDAPDLQQLVNRISFAAPHYSELLLNHIESGRLSLSTFTDQTDGSEKYVIRMNSKSGYAEWRNRRVGFTEF